MIHPWAADTGATGYILQVGSSPRFQTPCSLGTAKDGAGTRAVQGLKVRETMLPLATPVAEIKFPQAFPLFPRLVERNIKSQGDKETIPKITHRTQKVTAHLSHGQGTIGIYLPLLNFTITLSLSSWLGHWLKREKNEV